MRSIHVMIHVKPEHLEAFKAATLDNARNSVREPGIARFESGGTTPTLPLLERLAAALGLTLTVSLEPSERRSA